MKTCILIPGYNESRMIGQVVTEARKIIDDVIVVDDGSKDNTAQIAQIAGATVLIHEINKGKGKVVKQGILESSCPLVMFLDADLGIPIEELEKFAVEHDNGYDIIIASRFVPGIKIMRPVAWHRRLMEKTFRLLRVAIINDWNVKETQCGFKLFRREAALNIFPKITINRFAFDAEIVFVANKKGYKIKELPISLQNPPDSHVRLIRDPINMFFDLLRIRINDWRGNYN